MEYKMTEGNYAQMGVSHSKDGTIFTFEGKKEAKCAILLYQIETGNVLRLAVPADYCVGSLRSVLVKELDTGAFYYNYEIDGRVIVDPYAVRIQGREHWFETGRYHKDYQVWGGFEDREYDWQDDRHPEIPKEDMVLYKLHVRGFTMDGGAFGRKKGTFEGLREKLPYLHALGVTSVELMPVYEFEEMVLPVKDKLPDYLTWKIQEEKKQDRKDVGLSEQKEELPVVEKVNFWGYIPGNYFAPKAAYASQEDAVTEYKNLIRTMHGLSMECIMELYFDEKTNQNMMLDVLRFWVMKYHVDGFHLIGSNLPVRAMAQDVLLSRTKLFYTGFEQELLEDRTQYPHLYVYNDEYLYPLRKLLNHMDGSMMEFVGQQRKQQEFCGYVNYTAINNGFTLADVFSYSEKHNMQNGENNADGLNFNFTGNYGMEGPTRKKYILSIRKKQMRNAFAMVILAQGVPLIASGDEFGNSQEGNNNAYCQDNKTGWVNWKNARSNADLTEYVCRLLKFRKEHPVIRQEKPMRLNDYLGTGCPDLSYHSDEAWVVGFEPGRQCAGILYCGAYAKTADKVPDDDIYIAYNFHSGKKFLALPKLAKGKNWYLIMDTAEEQSFEEEEKLADRQDSVEMEGMSVRILIGK